MADWGMTPTLDDVLFVLSEPMEDFSLPQLIALLERGAPLEEEPGENAALHVAVIYNHIEAIPYLIQKGASLHLEGVKSFSPLHIAVYMENDDAVAMLLEHWDGDCQPLQDYQQTGVYTPEDDLRIALCIAIIKNQMGLARVLVAKGAPLISNEDRFSPAHIAAILLRDMNSFFIGRRIDMQARDYQGNTIEELIAAQNHASIRDYINTHRAELMQAAVR